METGFIYLVIVTHGYTFYFAYFLKTHFLYLTWPVLEPIKRASEQQDNSYYNKLYTVRIMLFFHDVVYR